MLTVQEVLAVVRVHADRVHDAVRRLGCGPDAAVRVVESSAYELVDTAARNPAGLGDPVGWWFARARALGRAAAGGDETLPVGVGVLAGDAHQVRLAQALESLGERERAALLLRDSYDLSAESVGAALSLDADSAMEVVGQARLALLPLLTQTPAPVRGAHPTSLAALARLAEGGHPAAREGGTRRHVQGCDACAALLDAQERARRLLTGLTVVALPDADRERILSQTQLRAEAALPAAVEEEDLEEDEPRRGYSLSLMALGLLAAAGLGAGLGALASRGGGGTPFVDQGAPALVTAAPVLRAGPTAPATTPPATVSPSPRVFVVTPSPTPTPSHSPTPTPTASSTTATLQLNPAAGPAGTTITVSGSGWLPSTQVTVTYHNSDGTAGGIAQVTSDANGTFTTSVTASQTAPLTNQPGPHNVSATDGTHNAQATFTATS